MRYWINLYLQQLQTTTALMFQYRAALAIWMIGHVLEPLVYLVVWSAVAGGRGGSVGDYSVREFAAYFILLMLVNHVSYTWIMYEFDYRIRLGRLSFALLRPVHPIHSDIADNISSKLITFPFMLLVAGVLALLFHPDFHFQLWALAVAVPTLGLAFVVRFLLEWTLANAAFWTTRVSAINQTYFVLVLFLSGQMAPLSLFPDTIQWLARLLPFRWLIGFPVELLLGRLSPQQALIGWGALAGWLLVALVLWRWIWRLGVRNYSAVGA